MDKQIKERGIIFNGEMVRAILDGSKTQTRRVIKNQPFDRSWSRHDHHIEIVSGRADEGAEIDGLHAYTKSSGGVWSAKCPFGKVGDRLYVRETFACFDADWIFPGRPHDLKDGPWENVVYSATEAKIPRGTKRPSIHMPRWASRITLEITDIRVERLHGINEEDAKAEGVRQGVRKIHYEADNELIYCNYLASKRDDASEWFDSPIDSFLSLWESIYGAESWQHGPWVWVVEFKRVEAA